MTEQGAAMLVAVRVYPGQHDTSNFWVRGLSIIDGKLVLQVVTEGQPGYEEKQFPIDALEFFQVDNVVRLERYYGIDNPHYHRHWASEQERISAIREMVRAQERALAEAKQLAARAHVEV